MASSPRLRLLNVVDDVTCEGLTAIRDILYYLVSHVS